MILLDEIDVKKEHHVVPQNPIIRRETLPSYSSLPVPHSQSQLSLLSTTATNLSRSPTSPSPFLPGLLHPSSRNPSPSRSASVPSLRSSNSSLTLNGVGSNSPNGSSKINAVCSKNASPGRSQLASTSALHLPFIPSITTQQQLSPYPLTLAHTVRSAPPLCCAPANRICIRRVSAPILGTFVVDPALYVPACLLPDDEDVMAWEDSPVYLPGCERTLSVKSKLTKSESKAKGKERTNISLKTRSGDICAEVWMSEGCAERHERQRKDRWMRQQLRREASSSTTGTSSSISSPILANGTGEEMFWQTDFEASSKRSAMHLQNRAEIEVESESGSITLKFHAPPKQHFKARITCSTGPISISLPKTFYGHVYTYPISSIPSSSLRPDNAGPTTQANVDVVKGKLTKRRRSNSIKGGSGSGGGGSGGSSSHIQNLVTRLPVLFSKGMEPSVRIVSEQKWAAKGEYFIGDHASRDMNAWNVDELHIESHSGLVGISYNDEPNFGFPKGVGLLTKLINKARS